MLIGQRDSIYEGIWNLTGNSKIGLSNTNGVASFEWSEAIKAQKKLKVSIIVQLVYAAKSNLKLG